MSKTARRMYKKKANHRLPSKLDGQSCNVEPHSATIIVECPHPEGDINHNGQDVSRSLSPERRSPPCLCVTTAVRAKSLSPAKVRRPSAGALGSLAVTIGVSKCSLLVEGEEVPHRSPSQSPRHSVSSTGSACSLQGSKDGYSKRQDHGSGQRVGLGKLARRLMHKSPGGSSPTRESCSPPTFDTSTSPRAGPRRSASMDSLLDSVLPGQRDLSEERDASPRSFASAATPGHGGSTASQRALPTSPSVPAKLAKSVPGHRLCAMEILLDGLSLGKSERKKLEKLNKFNIDLQALFAAVEHHHVERARSILESTRIDVNSVNSDGFTPLDVAVMTGQTDLIRLLQKHGAQEGTQWSSAHARASQLSAMLREAQRCVEDLTACIASASANVGSLSTALLREKERQLALWERRLALVSKMKKGFDELRAPDPPRHVALQVVGTRELCVTVSEPESTNQAPSTVTRYRVEWCQNDSFASTVGTMDVTDMRKLSFTISQLSSGISYFVRVAAGNGKGFSEFSTSYPRSATPSSWMDVEMRVPRWTGCTERLEYLFQRVIESRQTSTDSERSGNGWGSATDLCDGGSSKRPVRKSIRNLLFPAAPKFQKTLKRGVYFASLLYNEDRVLVTTEEMLPILEVEDVLPSSLRADFHWLVKVGCTWEDVKILRQDMGKSHSSSNVHFRIKLLLAVEQMQSALGIQDLGQLYHRPLQDHDGIVVFCVIKYVEDPKCINTLSVRWLPLTKMQRRTPSASDGGELPTATDLLTAALQEMMMYHQMSKVLLPQGLYLGYLKLKSSMDLISVLVPYKNPNMIPCCKIRDNQHVSREEWQWIKSLQHNESCETPTEVQLKFQRAISTAAKVLFSRLEISQELHDGHRVYDIEVVELNSEVSLLLVLPPVEEVCCVPGQRDQLTSRADCLTLPVQMFEVIHLRSYQAAFIACYCRVSSLLEMDTVLAQHASREAFSATEVAAARDRLSQLHSFQVQVEQTWRATRWIMDALTYARDRSLNGGLQLNNIWCPGDPVLPAALQEDLTPPPIFVRRVPRVDDLVDAKLFLVPHGTAFTSLDVSCVRRCASASRLILSGDYEDFAGERQNPHCDSPIKTDVNPPCFPSILTAENDVTQSPEKSTTLSGLSVLRIYAAYDCGLPSGTSMKIHVTQETTAREVIELFVRQLNTAVRVKGKDGPIYSEDRFGDFCLVAVVGSRERCLSDDYEPLRLQNPWTKGKLFVRLREENSGVSGESYNSHT